jgi:hypothetical protein
MIPLPADRILLANGDYSITAPGSVFTGRKCLLEIDEAPGLTGTFGGRTVGIGYVGESGKFVPYRDAAGAPLTTTAAYGREVAVPRSGLVAVQVSGGGTLPQLIVSLVPVRLSA